MVLTRALYGLWRLLKPLLLGYLLSSLMEPDPHKKPISYGCVTIMGLGALIGTISMRHSSYRSDVLGIGVSSALKALIYRKVNAFFFFIDLIFAAYGARCIGDNKRTTELFTQRGKTRCFEDQYLCEGNLPIISVYLILTDSTTQEGCVEVLNVITVLNVIKS